MSEGESLRDTDANPQLPLILDARPTLDSGQNFYDQPPFAAVIQVNEYAYGIGVDALRRALTNIARSQWARVPVSELASWSLALMHGSANLGTILRKKCGVSIQQRKTFNYAIGNILHAIVEYPYWMDYIRTHCTDDYFTLAGDQPGRAKADLPEEFSSYAVYAAERLRSEHSTILYGLADIFPQQLQDKSMRERIRESGEKWVARRYILLKASNLISS